MKGKKEVISTGDIIEKWKTGWLKKSIIVYDEVTWIHILVYH